MECSDLRTWAEIDLDALHHNYQELQSVIPQQSEMMAVVKANAYGHDDETIAVSLQQWGVNAFAVSSIREAIRLRQFSIKGEILILGYTPIHDAKLLKKYDITQAVISYEYGCELAKTPYAKDLKVHVVLDTGMHRIGLNTDDMALCVSQIEKFQSCFQVTALFTHLCVADVQSEEQIAFTQRQIDCIQTAQKKLSTPIPIHYLNSAGGLFYQSNQSKYTRFGIVLYGLKPDYDLNLPVFLKSVLSWNTIISMTKWIHAGDCVGYGCTYQATEDRKIATLPVGYADGYFRALSNKGYVLIHGKKANILGKVCMDQMMVDITDIPEAKVDDTAVLIGKSGALEITADDLAMMCGTIGYEIVCAISKRIPRVIKNGATQVKIVDYNALGE